MGAADQTYTDATTAPAHQLVARDGITADSVENEQQAKTKWQTRRARCKAAFCDMACSPSTWPQRILCVLFWLAVIAVGFVIFGVLLPKALANPIRQLIRLLTTKLTRGQLIAVIMGAVALLPCTLFLPMLPFVWIAGLVFPFGKAYALVMAASVIGMSIQYWAARYLFQNKVRKHLLERRKDGLSVALRAVELAGPWKVVALVRLGPSPYAMMNYIFGICPTIKYYHYIIASTLCIAHHRALSVFFGAALPTLAELFSGKPVKDKGVVAYRIVVLVLGIALLVVIVIWAKKALKKIQDQELERERAEAEAQAAADAAAAAEEGEAGATEPAACTGLDAKKSPMPLAIEAKMASASAGAAADAIAKPSVGATSSEGDLQVIVLDETSSSNSTAQDSALSLNRGGSDVSLIAVGQPPAALAATASGSTTSDASRMNSVSSLRGLLSGRFQRSA